MKLLIASVLLLLLSSEAMSSNVLPSCSWDSPGANAFKGDVAASVSHYTDIPPHIRQALQAKIRADMPDDRVLISRDAIIGSPSVEYDGTIRSMFFGRRNVCTSITRSKWAPEHKEPAKVFCEGDYCLLVPRICNNLSRISRIVVPQPVPDVPSGGVGGLVPTFSTVPSLSLGIPSPIPEEYVSIPGINFPTNQPICCYNGISNSVKPVTVPVPEPESWLMMGLGGILLMLKLRSNSLRRK